MKRLSLKARVTLWYTAFIVLLSAVLLAFLFALTWETVRAQRGDSLRRVVAQAVRDADLDDGELDADDVVFYREGVSVSFYDARGRLLAPLSDTRAVHALLEHETLKTVVQTGETFMVYDVYASIEGAGIWVRGAVVLSEGQKPIRVLTMLSLAAVPVFLLAAAAGGWVLMRRALRPVESMMETVNAIGDGNDLSLRIGQGEAHDEVGRLARTFDRLFDRLQQSFEKEKRFTADASHELRTPTAIIISECEFGLEKAENAAELRESLRVILRQSRKMARLIEQLLALARADAAHAEAARECVNFSELCRTVCGELHPEAEAARLTLTEKIQPDISVVGDAIMLMRALQNLIQNAIRYNCPGGSVTVELRAREDRAVVRVEDTGIGIAPEHLAHLFDRFYRVEASRSSARGGTGLGLAMVRSIALRHGGSVEVESREGRGSVFTWTIALRGSVPIDEKGGKTSLS